MRLLQPAICLSSIAASATGLLIPSAAMLGFGLLIYYRYPVRSIPEGGLDKDVIGYCGSLLDLLSYKTPTPKALSQALDRRYWFFCDMESSIRNYKLSGDTKAMRVIGKKYPELSELCMCISSSLETGKWLYKPLRLLMARQESLYSIRMQSLGGITNALSITRLGTTVFFPAFAGISLDIMSFGSGMAGGGKALGIGAISIVLVSYILLTNYVNAAFSAKGNPLRKASDIITFSSIASLIFSSSSYMGNLMLR